MVAVGEVRRDDLGGNFVVAAYPDGPHYIQKRIKCKACGGSGREDDGHGKIVWCPECEGKGELDVKVEVEPVLYELENADVVAHYLMDGDRVRITVWPVDAPRCRVLERREWCERWLRLGYRR